MSSEELPVQDPPENTETTPLLSPHASTTQQPPQPPYNPLKRKRHLLWLLAALLSLALTFLFLYYLLVPHTAQAVLDSSDLFLDAVELSEPHTDGSTLKIHINGRIATRGGILVPHVQAVTEPTELDVFDEDSNILGRFCMPSLSVQPGADATAFTVDTELKVLNSTALAEFGQKLVNEKEVYWNIRGAVKVRLLNGYLTVPGLTLRKTTSLKGMGGMKETKLLSFDLPSDHPSGGIRLIVNAAFENPSNVQMDLPSGLSVAIDLPETGGDSVRLAILDTPPSVKIVPGTNNLMLYGRILSYRNSPMELHAISKFFSETVTGKTATVVVQGLGIQGGKPLWLNEALNALSVPVNVPPQPKMKIVDNLDILSLGMKFTKELAYDPISTGKVRASIVPPFGFPIRVLSIAQSLDFFDIPDDETLGDPAHTINTQRILHAGLPFAHMTTPYVNVTSSLPSLEGSPKPIIIEADLPPSHLTVYPEKKIDFSQFMVSVFERDEKKLLISGTTSAVVDTAIGNVELRDVELEETVTLVGMSSLKHFPANITTMDVIGSSKTSVVTRSNIQIYSPANVDASLGRVSLSLSYCPENQTDCTRLGEAVIDNLDVRKGWNGLSVIGEITGCQEREDEWTGMGDGVRRFLGQYASDRPLNLTIHGHAQSSDVPSLIPLLSRLNLNEQIPPFPSELLSSMRFHALSDTSSFTLTNPMHVPISVIAVRANTTFRGHPVGSLTVDLLDTQDHDPNTQTFGKKHKKPAFKVPPLSTLTSPKWSVKLPRSGPGFELIKEILRTGGILSLDVYVRCFIGIGEWRGWIDAVWKDMDALVLLET